MNRLVYYIAEEYYEYEENKGLKEVVEVVTEWLEGARPASCCLIVKGLTERGWGCEVEASCVVRTWALMEWGGRGRGIGVSGDMSCALAVDASCCQYYGMRVT